MLGIYENSITVKQKKMLCFYALFLYSVLTQKTQKIRKKIVLCPGVAATPKLVFQQHKKKYFQKTEFQQCTAKGKLYSCIILPLTEGFLQGYFKDSSRLKKNFML